ncbi:hypothetical protein FRB95_001488 [Tulasnella sp. JGI-2019a]|nr:hypothetical protein FRB95_001488 [Tulasnella sp. JGI-2019a]
MSQELGILRLSYETLGQRIQHYIAERIQSFNSHSPFYRLPRELLVEIFALATNELDTPNHAILIILETPSLWAQISSKGSPQENTTTVLRSKEFPLRVEYDDSEFEEEEWRRAEFLDFAHPEAYRWQSAEFTISSQDTLYQLRRFASLSVPRLEHLEIDCSDLSDEELFIEDDIDIFCGGADRLRHLTLRDFPIPWCSHLLSQLKTLTISGWTCIWPSPSASDITDILRRCPKLSSFSFRYDTSDEIRGLEAIPLEAEVAHLPALTSLELRLEDA